MSPRTLRKKIFTPLDNEADSTNKHVNYSPLKKKIGDPSSLCKPNGGDQHFKSPKTCSDFHQVSKKKLDVENKQEAEPYEAVRIIGVKRARDVSFLNSKEGQNCYRNIQSKKLFNTVSEGECQKPSECGFVKPSLWKKQEA